MKIAVIGGTGFLGKAIAKVWREGDELLLTGSRDLDIRNPADVHRFIAAHKPAWVVLAAAYSNVDGCERDPAHAEDVNHAGAVHVAEACQVSGVRLIFISTDYVFAGQKEIPYNVDDPVAPENVYGRTKAAAEISIRKIMPDACIARTSWIFGHEGNCFPTALLQSIASGERHVRAVFDQYGVPNYSHDIAFSLMLLAHAGASGTVHVTNAGVTTWYEFARELVNAAALHNIVVEPIAAAELRRPAKRPRYSALSDSSLYAYGIQMPHWRERLPEFLGQVQLCQRSSVKAVFMEG